MFDDFFHQIETELGPLNPNWFEELTGRRSKDEADLSTVMGQETAPLTQEELFRAPTRTPISVSLSVSDSQICSTPKMFRCERESSLELPSEDSPAPGLQSLQGTESSPCLFSSANDSRRFERYSGLLKRDSGFDLFDSPKGVQRISESLGAQLNPDLSWSSSFNTPSALSPTIILSKKEEPCSPVSFLRDDVIIVRKLFPSLSKGAASEPLNASIAPPAGVQVTPESPCAGSVWKQTVPDAIRDGAVRDTVKSVLDGTGDVLSFFFSNSSSSLRKVKTRDRIKRRENGASGDQSDSGTDVTLKAPELTQWTPLSLSDVQDLDPDPPSAHPSQTTAAQSQGSPVRGALSETFLTPKLSNKPRKFVYHLQSSTSRGRAGVQNTTADGSSPSVTGPSPIRSQPVREACAVPKHSAIKQENPAGFVSEQDFDMTQLCKAFAEDFTQEIEAKSKISANRIENNLEGVTDSPGDAGDRKIERTTCSSTWIPSDYCGSASNGVIDVPQDETRVRETSSISHGLMSSDDVDDSGFKTASNRSFVQKPGSGLTASQRADISELCSILEEAGSQSEFTQIKPAAKMLDKEWDQEILTGIDFDDSFSTDLDRCREKTGAADGTGIQEKVKEEALQSGFRTAGGNCVYVSEKFLSKAKSLFEDLEGADESLGPGTTSGSVREASVGLGFSTAGGKAVTISEKALKNAKKLLEDVESVNRIKSEAKPTAFRPPSARHGGFKAAIDGKSKSVFKDIEATPTNVRSEAQSETFGNGFKTASGKRVGISEEALVRAKDFFKDCDANLKEDVFRETAPTERPIIGGRFGTASVPGSTIDGQRSDVTKENNVIPERSWGFSTASGKKVQVSDDALHKAKSIFASCEGLETDTGTDVASDSHKPETDPGLGPDPSELGFGSAASVITGSSLTWKQVGFSEQALGRAKDFFTGCDSDESGSRVTPNPKEDIFRETSPNEQPIIERGFGTASVTRATFDKQKSEVTKEEKTIPERIWSFSTASGKKVEVSDDAVRKAKSFFANCEGLETDTGADRMIPPSFGSELAPDSHEPEADPGLCPKTGPSLVSPASLLTLHLDGCTVTQQKYFEQEAMACTKALLEDDLNEQGPDQSGVRSSPKVSLLRRSETKSEEGKKRLLEDRSVTGQPPFKRRLVSEFDQTSVDRSCVPVQTSPVGTLSDRRVFRYDLKPSVTRPSSVLDQKAVSMRSDPKAPGFILPFRKKAETQRNPINASVPQLNKNSSGSSHDPNTSNSTEGNQTETKRKENQNQSVEPSELTASWQHSSELARDMQDMRIRKKKRQTIRPLPGTLYLAKTSGVSRTSLRQAVGRSCPIQHAAQELYRWGVSRGVSGVTGQNAESFRFSWDEFFTREALCETGGVRLGDGGWLIPDSRATLGKEEFYRALCDTPGVDPKLITEAWVYNHYRWIVWKRACMERTFPNLMGGRCLTPEQVLLQLKLRYDVEVDHSQRSALKKIMERDDTPAKALVLCVCGITKPIQNQTNREKLSDGPDSAPGADTAAVVWLTDGWYCIKALLDPPLSSMLYRGRLRVGGKLMIQGAELMGSQEACPPLEAPESLMLKISANGTRRARWDTKLGFYRDPRPFILPLCSLYPNGGAVGCVDLIVLRSYPTQWMEKKPGGVFVFRNERAEAREAEHHDSTKLKSMELLFSQIRAQFEREDDDKKRARRSRTFSRREIEDLQDGEELHEAMEADPALVEDHLSSEQLKAVTLYRQDLAEKKRAELQDRLHKAIQDSEGGVANRDVTPVWKLAVSDSRDLSGDPVYILNIWRPSVDLRSLLREGCRYKVYHLATSETKKRSGVASVQFTATKNTQFQDVEVSPDWLRSHFPVRRSVRFGDLQDPEFSSPCGEVDVVGYVLYISDRHGPSPVLYLVDESFDLVSVRMCSSLTRLALEDLIKPLVPLALSNLQLGPRSAHTLGHAPVTGLYAGEHALFSTQPKEAHLQEALTRLRTASEDHEHFFLIAQEKLLNLIPSSILNSGESPRTPASQLAQKSNPRSAVTPQQARVFSPFTPVRKNLPSSSDLRSAKRKRGVDRLSRLPPPAPLLPLGLVRSPRVSMTFNPPRRCETPRSAQTPRDEDKQWVKDEELALINTPNLQEG